MKVLLGILFVLWSGLLIASLVSLTQGVGWINLITLVLIILAWKNASGFLWLLRKS